MIRRSSPLLRLLLALVVLLLAVAPVSAYTHANVYHLRLTRLDPLACGTPIHLQALLTQHGTPVADVTVYFTIAKGAGDTVIPASDVTDGHGIASTFVTIACGSQPPHQVLASVANNASARITLCGSAQSCLRESRVQGSSKVEKPSAVEDRGQTARRTSFSAFRMIAS